MKNEQMATLQWFPKKKLLQLTLPENVRPLYGEVAEARFLSLANALKSDTQAIIIKN